MYFVRDAEEAARDMAASLDPTRVGPRGLCLRARDHGLGVIVTGVAIELTIAHPGGDISAASTCAILGGPAIDLAGNALFNRSLAGRTPWSRLIGIGALAQLFPLAPVAAPLVLQAGATLVTLILAVATGSPRHPAPRPET